MRLVVCTHAHTDHYGLAGADRRRAPAASSGSTRPGSTCGAMAEDPDGGARPPDRGRAAERGAGRRARALREQRRGAEHRHRPHWSSPIASSCPGSRSRPTSARWQVHETPGHAPSHVVLHQPESGLLISGDHLLGRISLFFDYGHTPDPVGEFIGGLDEVDRLERTGLCLAGHGRPFRDVPAKVAANRAELDDAARAGRAARSPTAPQTAFEIIGDLVGAREPRPRRRAPGACSWRSPTSTTWSPAARLERGRGLGPAALATGQTTRRTGGHIARSSAEPTSSASRPKDFEAASAFYTDVIGLERSKRWGDMPAGEFETGNLTLAVMQVDAFGIEFSPNTVPIALHVDDFEGAKAELESRGVEFRGDVIDSGVCLQAFFADPDGNMVGIHHRYAPEAG